MFSCGGAISIPGPSTKLPLGKYKAFFALVAKRIEGSRIFKTTKPDRFILER